MTSRGWLRFLWPLVLSLATLLTGCVDYDVGVKFTSPYSGAITQHIQVSDQLSSLAPADTRQWLNSLEKRTHQLQGNVQKPNSQELRLIVPFGNATELAEKFNQLFQASISPNATIPAEQADLVKLSSQVAINQNNLLLFERNSLDIVIDLRALNVLSQQDKLLIAQDSLANLKFQLAAPWIVRSISQEGNLSPDTNPLQSGLTWRLHPGEINHIQAVCWLPSPLGIGAVFITLVMILGYMLKYRRFPGLS